jgi:hypothetical protein
MKTQNAGKAGTTFSCRRGVGSGRFPLPLPRHCQPGRRDSETVPLLIVRSLNSQSIGNTLRRYRLLLFHRQRERLDVIGQPLGLGVDIDFEVSFSTVTSFQP